MPTIKYQLFTKVNITITTVLGSGVWSILNYILELGLYTAQNPFSRMKNYYVVLQYISAKKNNTIIRNYL